MSYLVLARKWRPQTFKDIVGQSHVTQVLRNAIGTGRIAHAYLFTGVRGVGKTTAARVLAKALNCERGPAADPCNECSQCLEITEGRSLDVYEIDGASNRGIDEVRQIIENVKYQPARSRFKIYIIDEVHQVTKDAFNALLKTLEEPPEFVKFILATTEPHRLPETILSRCQRFDFRRIQTREAIERLREIAAKESLKISDGALLLLAREAEGSMRDAQSLLEQMLSYAPPESGTSIDERLVENILGVTDRRVLYDISAAVLQGDAKKAVEIVAQVVDQGKDVARLSRELVEHFRNLLVARLSAGANEAKPAADARRQLLDLPDQEIDELGQQAAGVSSDTLLDYFKFITAGDEEVARSPYPRFALEAALVRLATLSAAVPITELIDRLEGLEKKLSGGDSRPSSPRSLARPSVDPAPAAFRAHSPETPPAPEAPEIAHAPAGFTAAGTPSEQWQKFVAFVTQQKKFLATHLANVEPLGLPPGPLQLAVEGRHHLTYLQDPENLSALKEFAKRFFSIDVSVSLSLLQEKRTQTDGTAGGGEKSDVVRDALKIFGGSVRQVKRPE
ncbi:MAG TPA: DNA polymerase III subunit gamma/tau [Candidatus Binatia bacterium]|jgi:DNA polymerase-3 subunit gamma/tau